MTTLQTGPVSCAVCTARILQGRRNRPLAAIIGVTGLAFEARIAAGQHVRAVCGGDSQTLRRSLASAISSDCEGLISFGVAGGLSPFVGTGACVVATSIISGMARLTTDKSWSRSLLDLVPGAVQGAIVGVSPPLVANVEAKRALYLRTGALAVDNESHVVASAAASRGLPMAAVRVVMDAADRELPQSVSAAIRPDGTIDLIALLRSAMKNPADLSLLLRTALDAMVGFTALVRCRPMLGPSMGLPTFQTPTPSSSQLSGPALCCLEDQ